MPYSHHLAERTLDLFKRRPFLVLFRVFVLTFAVMYQEFRYILLFLIGASIWLLETLALYIDPKLASHPLIRIANTFFFILAMLVFIIHFAPDITIALNSILSFQK